MSSKEYVKTQIENGIASVEFFHPAHNALPSILLSELRTQVFKAGADSEVKVICLRSGGDRTFCAGASFTELTSIQDTESGKQFFMGFAKVIQAIQSCGKIVVGRVQGKAVGGGVGLLAACDYVIASKYASIKLSELAIGIGPFVIGPAVERKVGLATFGNLALNPSEWQTAHWAENRGLMQEVFDTAEQMDAYLAEYLNRMATYSAEALHSLKKMLWEGTDHWENLMEERAAESGRLVITEKAQSEIQAFLA